MRSPVKLEQAPPRAVVRGGLAVRRALQRLADWIAPPEAVAYERAISFFATRVAGALIELGVIDALDGRRRNAAELAEELSLDPDHLHRTLRLASVQGLTRVHRGGRFSLTTVGATLRSDATPTLAPWVRHLNTEAVQAAWAALPQSIRTGEDSFPAVHGKSIWQHFAAHPDEERLFAEAMRELTALSLAWIVSGYPWPERGVVADVAGGSGPVLAGILAEQPECRGILIEAPGVLAEADDHLAGAGVRERVELVEGNIFERVEADADLYLLKDILHDYDDERSLQILRTVAAAMRPEAKLILIELPLERDEVNPINASVDLHMLTQCDGGRQRSIAELQELLRQAGLRPGEVHRAGPIAMVEGLR